jgi:hypothetical protein
VFSGVKFLLLLGIMGLFLIGMVYAQSNITGTYDGKGIYRIENMSVRITNESYSEPTYRFVGIVHNISNETMYMSGVTIQMFDSENNLLDFTGTEQDNFLPPDEKILYKQFASTKDNPDLDHYVVSVRDEKPPGNPGTSDSKNTEQLYDECVRVAGVEFCDFLFRR